MTCNLHSKDQCPLCKDSEHEGYVPKVPFGEKKSSLKKKSSNGSGRYITATTYASMIGQAKALQNGRCVGHLAGIDHDCEDPFDFMHWVKQQTMARELGADSPALSDARLGSYACRFIHGSYDGWSGPLKDPVQRAALAAQAHPDIDTAIDQHGLRVYFEREICGA